MFELFELLERLLLELELPERPLELLLDPEELLPLGRLTLPEPVRPLLELLVPLGRVLLELLSWLLGRLTVPEPVRPLLELLVPLGRVVPELLPVLLGRFTVPVLLVLPVRPLLEVFVLGRVVALPLLLVLALPLPLMALGSRELMLPGVLEAPGRTTAASSGLL